VPPVPKRVPVQGDKPMTVSKTVSAWADHLVEQAKSKAAKKIGVGDTQSAGSEPLSFDEPLFPSKPPARSLPALGDIQLPPQRHAYGEGPREGDDDTVSDFFFTQSDEEADRRRESKKRQERKIQQKSDPTSTSRFRALEVEAYSIRRFQIDRYVAPPGMENVVKRLKSKKGVDNPYAVAWAMHERDKHTHDRSIGGLTRIGPLEGSLHRAIRILDAVSDGHYGVSREVVNRLHADALDDLDRSFEGGDPIRDAWRHVVDQARIEALAKVSRHASEQGPPANKSEEDRPPEFPRDEVLEEMTGKGKGLKKASSDVTEYKMGGSFYRYRNNNEVDRHVVTPAAAGQPSGEHPHTKAVREISEMYDPDWDETDDSGDREGDPFSAGSSDETNLRAKEAGEALLSPDVRDHTKFLKKMAKNVVHPDDWGNDWMDQATFASGNFIANHARLALGMKALPSHWTDA